MQILTVLFFCFLSFSCFGADQGSSICFTYDESSIERLHEFSLPEQSITEEEFSRLNKEVFHLLQTRDLTELQKTLILPYLTSAQNDFACLSKRVSGSLKGNLGPITYWTLSLFIENPILPSITVKDFDVYSSSIASIVLEKAKERLAKEMKEIHDYPIKKGKNLWVPTGDGYVGLNSGSVALWLASKEDAFQSMSPPSEEDLVAWENECNEVHAIMEGASAEDLQSSFFWAGLTSPHAGSWDFILLQAFDQRGTSVEDRLAMRSLFSRVLCDANTACFHFKYTFWVPRPSQREPTIKPIIVIPSHPSYPSGHSTIAGAAEVMMTKFFPDQADKWHTLAHQSGYSRIYAGIHYVCDHDCGIDIGRRVSESALTQVEEGRRGQR